MEDKIRTIEQILLLLQEEANLNSFFAIGPDETPLLWSYIKDLQVAAEKRG